MLLAQRNDKAPVSIMRMVIFEVLHDKLFLGRETGVFSRLFLDLPELFNNPSLV